MSILFNCDVFSAYPTPRRTASGTGHFVTACTLASWYSTFRAFSYEHKCCIFLKLFFIFLTSTNAFVIFLATFKANLLLAFTDNFSSFQWLSNNLLATRFRTPFCVLIFTNNDVFFKILILLHFTSAAKFPNLFNSKSLVTLFLSKHARNINCPSSPNLSGKMFTRAFFTITVSTT